MGVRHAVGLATSAEVDMETPETMTVRAASTFVGLARPRPRPTPVEQIRGAVERSVMSLRSRLSGRRRLVVIGSALAAVLAAVVVLGPAALARVPRSEPQSSTEDPVLPLTPAAALPVEVGQAPPADLAGAAGGQPVSSIARTAADAAARPSAPSAPVGPTTPTVVVHAAGAVVVPGVYRLADPTRVTDVVAAAGGLTGDADPDVLNLAARVGDGERVFVPRRGQAPPEVIVGTTGSGSSTGSVTGSVAGSLAAVDLNAATAAQLDALPGIGPAIAERIIEARTRVGRFRSVNQLLDVPGIGEAKFSSLKTRVRV